MFIAQYATFLNSILSNDYIALYYANSITLVTQRYSFCFSINSILVQTRLEGIGSLTIMCKHWVQLQMFSGIGSYFFLHRTFIYLFFLTLVLYCKLRLHIIYYTGIRLEKIIYNNANITLARRPAWLQLSWLKD